MSRRKGEYVYPIYVDAGRGWELRCIASSLEMMRKYLKFFRGDPDNQTALPPKVHAETCELDHAMGCSMIDLPYGYRGPKERTLGDV